MCTVFRQISDTVKQSFTTLSGWERAEFAILTTLTVALTIDWRVSMWLMALLVLVSLAWHIAAKGEETNGAVTTGTGEKGARWICYSTLAFFAINLIGAIRSRDLACGMEDVTTKLSLLVLPLLALLKLSPRGRSRSRLSAHHIRLLLYVLWAALLLQLAVWLTVAVIRYSQGTPVAALMGENFAAEHHSYLALYILVAMAFAASEIMRQCQQYRQLHAREWMLLASELALTLFVVLMDSRAGIVVILLLTVIMLVDYADTTHRWKGVVLFSLLIIGGSVLVYQSLPKEYRRFDNTIKRFKDGDPVDIRSQLAECVWETAESHWVLGLGNGDAQAELRSHYLNHDLQEAYDNNIGPHNQYLTTLLECGLLGTVLLMAMLLMPAIVACRKRMKRSDSRQVVLIIAVTASIIFFESMLGRASGVMFIAFIYYIITLWTQKTSTLPS